MCHLEVSFFFQAEEGIRDSSVTGVQTCALPICYIPTDAEDPCRCGSGKQFGSCCQPLPYWRPICPNPGMQGYSLIHSQSARFTNIPADAVYDFLQDDERLYLVEDTPHPVFCVYSTIPP